MISKSPKEIYQKTSQNLQDKGHDISEEVVKQFNLFLFGKINSALTSFEHTELYVPHLGTWKFRRKKGEEYLKDLRNRSMYKALLGTGAPESLAIQAQKAYEDKMARVRRLIELHEEMIQKKLAFKKKRNDGSSSIKGDIQE